MEKLHGVIPALVTPLTEKEELNVPVLCKLTEDLLKEGAYGFYIGGATGEGISLRREVREALAYEVIKKTDRRVPCIVHVASTDFSEARELAMHAERCGADYISAIPPLFYTYDEDDVYDYYKKLASSVHIPLMVYYSPAASFSLRADFAARLFSIDNVTAIKWTSSDFYGLLRLKELTNGEMTVMNGSDEMLIMGLSAGADGGIGSTYNFQLPLIREIYECFREGRIDEARAAQATADKSIYALLRYMNIPATKAVLSVMGYDVGNAAFPMKRYTDDEKRMIYSDVFGARNK